MMAIEKRLQAEANLYFSIMDVIENSSNPYYITWNHELPDSVIDALQEDGFSVFKLLTSACNDSTEFEISWKYAQLGILGIYGYKKCGKYFNLDDKPVEPLPNIRKKICDIALENFQKQINDILERLLLSRESHIFYSGSVFPDVTEVLLNSGADIFLNDSSDSAYIFIQNLGKGRGIKGYAKGNKYYNSEKQVVYPSAIR